VAGFNRANTLHMLDRDEEAYPILRKLVVATEDELRRRCPDSSPRSLQLDACMLLFWVALGCQGRRAEAFDWAAEHLRRRKRGVQSVWSARQVRSDIAAMRSKNRGKS